MKLEIKTKIYTNRAQKSLPYGERIIAREEVGSAIKKALRIEQKPDVPSVEVVIYYGGDFLPEHLWLSPLFGELRKGWISDNCAVMIKQKNIFGFEIQL